MDNVCYVLGVYPPPYGGATVKCQLFSDLMISKGCSVEKINLYGFNKFNVVGTVFQCVKAFCSTHPIIYCVDSKRLRAILFIQRLFKGSFSRTTILAVGGVFNEITEKYFDLNKCLKAARGIWVETEGLKRKMEMSGFSNVHFFPNPKTEHGCCAPRKVDSIEPLRLLYFSQISRKKGVNDIIELTRLLENRPIISYVLDYYGHIVPDFQKEFKKYIENYQNVHYCGIFDATKASIYEKLNEYDILLFPTHWDTEGVPGILVEAKMAGLAVIASDKSYNCEIVQVEQGEGFIVKGHYAKEMFEVIKQWSEDREALFEVKRNSYRSRKRYSLEEYQNMVNQFILGGGG